MVTFIRLYACKDLVQARKAFQGTDVKLNSIQDRCYSPQAVPGVFNRYAANGAVYFIAFREKQLRQIGTVLPGDSCNQSPTAHRQRLLIECRGIEAKAPR